MTMRQLLLAALLGAACSAFVTSAADPMLSVSVGSEPQLNDVAGIVNKNAVLKSNNVAITSSSLAFVQDDMVTLEEAVDSLPTGVFLTGQQEPILEDAEATDGNNLEANDGEVVEQRRPSGRLFRQRFCFHRDSNVVCSWRYPLWYWYIAGRRVYGHTCFYSKAIGPFFYC